MRKKLSVWTHRIFTIGIGVALLAGAILFAVIVSAFLIGGETAEHIIRVVREEIFPILFLLNVIFCVFGMIHVYLIRDKGFRFNVNGE